MSSETIFQLFRAAARWNCDDPALMLPGREVTYAGLERDIDAAADELAKKMPETGPVTVQTDDAGALLIRFFAAAEIGRPALPLDPAAPPSLLGALSDIDSVEEAPYTEGENVSGKTEFYWGLTSGTTGAPKLFARSHASWIASFEAAEAVFSFPPRSQILIPGPLHHSLFLYGAVHALCRGHTLVLPGQFRPNRLREAAGCATHLYAVPFMLREMLKAGVDAPKLRAIFCGGAKLPAELRRDCERAWPDADLVEFYGASETSFVTFHSTRSPASDGSVGRPFPGVSIDIRGEKGERLRPGEAGKIFVSSPMLFSRYVGEESAGEWFSPGDTGFSDETGCLHLTGRTNRVIKSKGLKIHPEAIEAALLELPQIRRVAVVDLSDNVRGAVAVAAIEFSGAPMLRRSLAAHCRQTLGSRYCPRGYFAAEHLPMTRSGKVAVAEVREALIGGHAAYREIR
jgi:long-chain acyl-CoA synthetase